MKRTSLKMLIVLVGLLGGVSERADEWGCKVLLCLSNPSGPTAERECVPPIERLWDHLHRGGSFPTCQLSDGSGSAAAGTYVRQRVTHYDPCPAGTIALAPGARAASSQEAQQRRNRFGRDELYVATYATGIGSGDGFWPQAVATGTAGLPPKVCVGTRTGTAWGEAPNDDGTVATVPVELYDRVVRLPAHASPRVIEVYVDNTLAQRVRW